ncbi:hypothetical protein GCM10028818_24800 [Spirosoma horti]
MDEAFGGIIRYDPWLLIIDFIFIVYFLIDWYGNYRKTGSYINYWYFNMFLVFFVPILIMYPFNSSTLNVFTVLGPVNLSVIEKSINEAYIVTIVGFTAVYLGKYIYDNFKPVILLEVIISLFSKTLGKFFSAVAKDNIIAKSFAVFYITLLIGFVFIMFVSGQLKNPREFFMLNKQYAPIYTFILSTFEVTFLIISTRVLQYKFKIDKVLFFLLIILGFFLGVRAPIIWGGLSFGVLYVLTHKNGYIPIYKVTLFIMATLVVIMGLSFIRNSSRDSDIEFNFDIAMLSFLPEIFYGNTFSDLRDFSWVLGYWNREHYWGLSYIAAFLSFIPSSIFPIRDLYGIGKITVRAAGLDIDTHPGLRMGMFGEMYINFGIIGVVLFGILWGYIYRRLDVLTKRYAKEGNIIKVTSIVVYSSFISYLTVSAGFWGFYITSFVLAVLYFFTRVKFSK